MNAIKIDPEIMHGVPCFDGTRVPVKSLFDYLAAGHGLDYFVYQFPIVKREQAQAILKEAKAVLVPDPEWLVDAERRRLEGQAQDNKHQAAGAA